MKRRHPLRLIAILLALPEVLYLLAGNVYLNYPGGPPGVNPRPEKVRVSYAWGFTLWPTRVVLASFAIHGESRRVTWDVASPRVSGHVDLLALGRRRFSASALSASDVEVAIHTHPATAKVDNAPADPSKPAWAIALADVTADVRSMTLDTAQVRDVRIHGGMELHLKKDLRLAPGHADLQRVELRVDDRVIATLLDGSIDVESDAFRYRGLAPADAFSHFSGRLKVSADVLDASSLTSLVTAVPWIALEKSAAHVDAALSLDKGRLVSPSSVTLCNTRLAARILDYSAEGDGGLSWALLADRPGAYTLDAKLDAFKVARDGFAAPHVLGRGLTLHASGDKLPLGDATVPTKVDVELPEADVPHMSFYNGYLPPGTGFEIVDGAGTLHASLSAVLPAGQGTGHLELVGRNVKATYREVTFTGRLLVETRMPNMDLATRTFTLDGTRLRIDDGIVTTRGRQAEPGPWWLEAKVKTGRIHPGAEAPLEATISAILLDSRPLLALFTAGKPLPAIIEHAVRLHDLEGDAVVHQSGNALDFEKIHVTGSGLELRGRIRLGKKVRHGAALLSYGSLALGIGVQNDGTDFKILAARKWYEAQGGP